MKYFFIVLVIVIILGYSFYIIQQYRNCNIDHSTGKTKLIKPGVVEQVKVNAPCKINFLPSFKIGFTD